MIAHFRHICFVFGLFSLMGWLGCAKETLAVLICEPGTLRCGEIGAETCNLKGTGWLETPCPEGEACTSAQCEGQASEARCKPIVCEPNELVCGDDHVYVYQCDESGTIMTYKKSCIDPPQLDGVCADGECVSVCTEAQKSYLGCEYFAVDLDNADVFCGYDDFGNVVDCEANNAQYAVVLSNPDPSQSAYVTISIGDMEKPTLPANRCEPVDLPTNYVTAGVIPPRGIQVFELPSRNVNGTVLDKLAYRVASNIPISAYQFNPLENVAVYSNDASLLLPTTTASSDYLVMTREQTFDELKGFLTVVGIKDEPTEVTVTVTARTLPGIGIPAMMSPSNPENTATFTLNKYEVLNIETNQIGADLTGSRVQANRDVIVYAGSEAANAPNTSRCNLETLTCEGDANIECGCDEGDTACSPHAPCAISALITCCADHLEQQLFPITTWGREYVAVRSYPRGPDPARREKDVWRFLASQDGTTITLSLSGVTVPVLNTGQWFEIESDSDFLVSANKPILVGQFLAAEQAPDPGRSEYDAGTGDPAFILTVPKRQFRDSYVFLAPDKYEWDFVSIAKRVGGEALLDGVPVEEVPGAEISSINTDWKSARIRISDGFHTLSCPEDPDRNCVTQDCYCSVMVHGYDQYVSYGYPGGLNLEDAAR